MGYTHYWEKTNGEITNEQWNAFKEFVSNLICKTEEGSIENSAGGTNGGVVICNGDGTGEPTLSDEIICFNGQDEDSHESFYIQRSGGSGFNFCKTARKPYDPVVVACLIEAEKLGIVDSWSSDGNESDLQSGINLHKSMSESGNDTMNETELNQIIFNALETEYAASKREEYRAKVKLAMQEIRNRMNGDPKGTCRECGSFDIARKIN